MNITIDQAHALVAFADQGSFAAAAKVMRKNHTAIVYALGQLEAQTDLVLLDRSAYRTRLTDAGQRVLEAARALLRAEADLHAVCETLRSGWEPSLRIVFDGVFPSDVILRQVQGLLALKVSTRVEVSQEFLGRVEAAFAESDAHLMISVLPAQRTDLEAIELPAFRMVLVAHRNHPLAQARRLSMGDLAEHVLLTVRGSDPRLRMPTAVLEERTSVHLNDFHSKKDAIVGGLGYGWMPEALVARELARGTLKRLSLGEHSAHTFKPHAYVRRNAPRGRALERVLEGLRG